MNLAITFGAYLVGALMGLAVHRAGPRLKRGWPVYLRLQLVATAALLGLFSAWRLTAPHQIVAPILIACVGGLLLGVAQLRRGQRSSGLAQLEGWAAFPNGTFWVLPIAGALIGPAGTAIAALTNAVYALPNALCIHLMRRDAPIRQRRSTTGWTSRWCWPCSSAWCCTPPARLLPASKWILTVSGPLLAFVGAALYTGSVLHPHNASVSRTPSEYRRWLFLASVRIAYLALIALVTGSTAVAVIAVLSALGPPAFNPPQQAVLYGYRSGVVMVAVRWGWLFLPIGLGLALVIR